MRARMEGLVQLRTGDAVRGVISRTRWPWRYVRVDTPTALSVRDPDHPAKIDGIAWIPKENVSFIQELVVVGKVTA